MLLLVAVWLALIKALMWLRVVAVAMLSRCGSRRGRGGAPVRVLTDDDLARKERATDVPVAGQTSNEQAWEKAGFWVTAHRRGAMATERGVEAVGVEQ
jgi:hypothetical protein